MDNKLLLLTVSGVFVILFAASAYAQLGVPHQFKGKVITNGVPAPDGLSVVAKIDGQDVASTTTVNGNYGRLPGDIFYIEDPDGNKYGKTIEFFVNGINAADYVFNNGESTELDLSVTGDICGDTVCTGSESCSSCPQDCGECQQTNDGTTGVTTGGTTGGITGGTTQEPCEEDWTCSDWSICSQEGRQLRSCTDANSCGTEKEKPVEEKTCVYSPAEAPSICAAGTRVCTEGKLLECYEGRQWNVIRTCEYGCDPDEIKCKAALGTGDGITGFLAANPAAFYGIIILILAVIGAGVYWKRYR